MNLLASLGASSIPGSKGSVLGADPGRAAVKDGREGQFSSALEQSNHRGSNDTPVRGPLGRSKRQEGEEALAYPKTDRSTQGYSHPKQNPSESGALSAFNKRGFLDHSPSVSTRPPQEPSVKETRASGVHQGVSETQDVTAREGIFAAMNDGDETVDSLSRRLALQKFIRKMKEELDVEPSQLVAAFSGLSVQELLQPPDVNLKKIVESLGLNAQDKQVAEALFQDMLKQTTAGSMADYLKSSKRQLSLEVMSQRERQSRDLDQSLNQLNKTFFNPPQGEQPVAGQAPRDRFSQEEMATGPMGLQQKSSFTQEGLSESSLSETSPEVPGQATAQTRASTTKSRFSTEGWQRPESINTIKNLDVKSKLSAYQNMSPATQAKGAEALSAASSQVSAETSQITRNLSNQGPEKATAEPDLDASMMNLGQSSESSSDGEAFSGDTEEQASSERLGSLDQAVNLKTTNKSEFILNPPNPTEADEAANVKELINQAQVMIRKGGGEMKVQMTPEGLGEVTMKVAVENGQVSVEMVTDSNDAKKLIEKGLGDLKATLASHKLNVDQIKVDITQDLAKQFDQQREQGQREMAHQFMQDFREQNQSWRQSYFDLGEPRVISSDMESNNDVQLDVSDVRRPKEGSRRLNLVA